MSSRPDVYLHIGAMKTGTSYLQHLLIGNRDVLADEGICFPLAEGWGSQVSGIREILQQYRDAAGAAAVQGAWQRLLSQITAHSGRAVVVSMEFMSFARPDRARALVAALQPATVHVVVTVRDAGRVLPAQWQETTQNRGTASWQDFIDGLLGRSSDDRVRRAAMRALDVPRMLAVWGALVPAKRLHVVTVPPRGASRELLWGRFATVLGVEPTRYAEPQRTNESLGYVSADLMRRLNGALGDLPRAAYNATVKAYLCKQVLATRSGEPALPVTAEVATFMSAWNSKLVQAIRDSDARVYGDLDDLLLPPPVTADRIELPPVDATLAAADDAMAGLREQIRVGRRRRARERRRHARPDEPRAAMEHQFALPPLRLGGPATWSAEPDPVAAAVFDLDTAVRRAAHLLPHRRRSAAAANADR